MRVFVETAYLSLPLSPDRRSSCLAGVSAGSSFPRPPSSSSDLAQCAGMEPKHPVTDMEKTRRGLLMGLRRISIVCIIVCFID